LFGQGAGAATGGAIGGVAGGLLGPGGSFAGSLLGTLIGDIASKGQAVKKLGEDIGFSTEQTRLLEAAFKQAGSEFDKFESSVQNIRGLSLDIEDQANAIRLVSTLTKNYGGEIDKVTNAYTSALESGKVTQATLNQLTSQGIPIQQALADKYKVSRSEILQMAKDGKISVQELSDTLVEMGNKGVTETNKTKSGFDVLKTSVTSLGSELAGLGGSIVGIFQGPFDWLLKTLGQIIQTSANGIASLRDLLNFSTPAGEKAKAALQAGRLPAGPEGVIDVIGEERYRALGEQAGPGPMGFGRNLEKFQKLLQQQPEFQVAKPPAIQNIKVPGQLPPSGAGGGGGKPKTDKAAEDPARLEQQIQERLRGLVREVELIDQIAGIKELQFQAEMEGNKELQIRLQGEERIIQIMQTTARALDGITDQRLKQNILAKAESELASAQQETLFEMQRLDTERTKAFDEIIAGLDLELALKTATTEQAREQLRLEAEIAKIRGDKSLTPAQQESIIGRKTELTRPKTDRERLEGAAAGVKAELDTLTDPINAITTAAAGIGDAFSTSFKGIISGSMTAKEALASFFTSVADMFLDMAAQIIAKMITMAILNQILGVLPGVGGAGGFTAGPLAAVGDVGTGFNFDAGAMLNFGGFKAKGGPVSSGQSYMVGERGPELFMPGRSGTIVPNDKMGGGVSVMVNVDASGSKVEGDEQEGKQLGRVIAAAIQQELVKQKRPGGLLA
jgi:tape measure domain-containing protein